MGEENIIALSKKVEEKIQEQFKNVDNICQINSLKVIKAFQEANKMLNKNLLINQLTSGNPVIAGIMK